MITSCLYVICKQLSEKIQGMNQARQPGSFTPRHDPKGRSEWRSEIYELVNKIVRLNGSTMKAVLKQGYDYLCRNYGWYFKDERRMFVERTGYKGDIAQISGLDIIESSEMYKSIFMSIMKDRLEIEKDNAAAKSGIVSALSKRTNPPVIPADAIPKRRAAEPEPVVEAECRVVESKEPVPIVVEPKKKKYYKASITLPIIKPIAEKRGDKTVGYWVTYQKIYDIVGVAKMNRLTKAYVRAHNRLPKSKTDIFAESEKNMKIFKEAAKALDAVS